MNRVPIDTKYHTVTKSLAAELRALSDWRWSLPNPCEMSRLYPAQFMEYKKRYDFINKCLAEVIRREIRGYERLKTIAKL